MEVTARTDDGKVITVGSREYREAGLDLEGRERLGAWQIKEVLDLSLPPGKRTEERFITEFPPDTKSADIEVTLKYSVSGNNELMIHRTTKQIRFGR